MHHRSRPFSGAAWKKAALSKNQFVALKEEIMKEVPEAHFAKRR